MKKIIFGFISLFILSDALLAAQTAVPSSDNTAADAKVKARLEEESQLKKINDENYALYQLLVDTIDQVEANYVKPISRKELIEAAIGGVVAKLDPYSNYIPAESVDNFRMDLENRFGGLGIHVSQRNDSLVVVTPLADSPAYRAGIRPNDVIVSIDDKSTKGLNIDQATELMKGTVGSNVKLSIQRPGKKPFDVSVTRDIIHLQTVSGCSRNADDSWNYWIDVANKIAYVRISSFSQRTTQEMKTVLKTLNDQGMRGLLLDLRFNPGGTLSSAIEICDMFIDDGVIVSVKGRQTDEKTWFAKKDVLTKASVAVLINHFSASAAEIVSACLQDHNRAMILGERSWGKGSVQNVIDMDGGALKLTTSGYFRPSGKNIHREENATEADQWGVTPNTGMEIKLNRMQTEQVLWRQQFLDILQNPEKDKDGKPIVAATPNGQPNRTVPVLDPQTSRALNWMLTGK